MPCAPQNVRRSSRHLKALRKFGQRLANAYRRVVSQLEIGAWGERAACRYLTERGLIPIKRNWHAGRLEADVVLVDGKTIVVAEVKTRHMRFMRHHPAVSAITTEKYTHLERLAASFMRNNGPLCRRFGLREIRIDAVEIYYEPRRWSLRKVSKITWHRGLEGRASPARSSALRRCTT
jgi:putative endonuclease